MNEEIFNWSEFFNEYNVYKNETMYTSVNKSSTKTEKDILIEKLSNRTVDELKMLVFIIEELDKENENR